MIMDEPQAAVREAIGSFQNPHDLEAVIDVVTDTSSRSSCH